MLMPSKFLICVSILWSKQIFDQHINMEPAPLTISKRQQNKAKRKEGKAKSILLKHENIKVSDSPSNVSQVVHLLGGGEHEHIHSKCLPMSYALCLHSLQALWTCCWGWLRLSEWACKLQVKCMLIIILWCVTKDTLIWYQPLLMFWGM